MYNSKMGGDILATKKYTEARKRGNQKWDAENLDRLSIAAPKGYRDTLKARAAARGESVNAYIIRAINAQIEQDRQQEEAEADSTAPPLRASTNPTISA